MAGKGKKDITVEEFDRIAEEGGDLSSYLDLDTTVQRVNIDFPAWVVAFLDAESKRQGISRQALIKSWLVQRIDDLKKSKSA